MDGKDTGIWTKMSHGGGKNIIDDGLLHLMARQIGISQGEIKKYVDCDIDKTGLIEILKEKGLLK